MNRKVWNLCAGVCALVIAGTWTAPVTAQSAEVKEKPRMYTFVSNWVIPRARWAEMEKAGAANAKIFDKALASGALVGYGDDMTLVHEADGSTHDTWWSAPSMAGIVNVLDEIYKAGNATTAVLGSATKHWDNLYVSRFYNWHSGSSHGAYTRDSTFRLKPDAPDDAVEILSKGFIVPLMEKLLADGTLQEYEIDEQAIHTQAPGMFEILYISPNAEGLDKANAALGEALKASPLAGPALGSMVDFTAHRDDLSRTNATYK